MVQLLACRIGKRVQALPKIGRIRRFLNTHSSLFGWSQEIVACLPLQTQSFTHHCFPIHLCHIHMDVAVLQQLALQKPEATATAAAIDVSIWDGNTELACAQRLKKGLEY
eukprot:scaffold17337_cov18-Tisochrysis_lutea.AAC.1